MKDYKLFLQHILTETEVLERNTNNLLYDDFIKNEILCRAFIRSLEVIGEAVKNIPESIRKTYSDIEWKKLAGMRDKLIHHYFGIDYEMVWDAIKRKMPELKVKIMFILKNEK
ncbi:MAG: hypothetical protein A2Y33_16210 [Spirochaetes bacterium GWF1_51_8]|nr:MAG: hypothetical protein A2Y33_16210 [Spirochaetes bacterium GWF1_51_8]